MNTVTDTATDSVKMRASACDVELVRLADGATVRLRAASRGNQDDDAFRRMFFTLSDTTRYMYFCAGVPSTETWAERFVELGHTDAYRSFVLAADVDGELVGFARFSQEPGADPHTVEIGIMLTDAWQGKGLGRHMLCTLATKARQRGITTFTAVMLWENRRMLRLARRTFPDMRLVCGSGSCELTMNLNGYDSSGPQ